MNIAIIPARGGSKRIPNKNIKDFCGKPIIYYSINNAIKSKIFDKIFVSTDSSKIADISVSYGAEAPFIRPKKISDDYASTLDVMAHASSWAKNKFKNIKSICCIYATAPLLRIDDLIFGYNSFLKDNWNYVISITDFSYPIDRALLKNNDESIEMFDSKNFNKRSQDLRAAFHDAGQFYIGKTDAWIKRKFCSKDIQKQYIFLTGGFKILIRMKIG